MGKRRKTRRTEGGRENDREKTRSPVHVSGYATEKKKGKGNEKGENGKNEKN